MSTFSDLQKVKYAAVRNVSRGADITLVRSEAFRAMSQCANKVAEMLGQERLVEWEDGIFESCVTYDVPLAEVARACDKLSSRYSVALVDLAPPDDKNLSRWVLLWKIERKPVASTKPSMNLNDY